MDPAARCRWKPAFAMYSPPVRRGGAARCDQVKRSVTKYARHDFVFDGRQGVDGLAWQSSKAAICAEA
jgi:hypothetical protein